MSAQCRKPGLSGPGSFCVLSSLKSGISLKAGVSIVLRVGLGLAAEGTVDGDRRSTRGCLAQISFRRQFILSRRQYSVMAILLCAFGAIRAEISRLPMVAEVEVEERKKLTRLCVASLQKPNLPATSSGVALKRRGADATPWRWPRYA